MKYILFTVLILVVSNISIAHNLHDKYFGLSQWHLNRGGKIEGDFLKYEDGKVTFILKDHSTKSYQLSDFSSAEQSMILEKYNRIKKINSQDNFNKVQNNKLLFYWLRIFGLIIFLILINVLFKKFEFNLQTFLSKPIYIFPVIIIIMAFTYKTLNGTDPIIMDEAFKPFKPNVNTRWDNQYFYVESKGIPTTHDMMKGITAWQQQVPIPQCYVGSNAWSIPLNPEIASAPVPVNQKHFLRGAVAVAVNGIAIFNPYTNTGVDALLDGQLDNWGGHCGRADDYHYHIAPLHLYDHTSLTQPIAFALDGFAIYGSKEPDGSDMKALDANHGHYFNGIYHYHGTATAPYMIGNMVGKVTEDSTLQIVPQATAKPIRPSLTPLKGATITSCVPNANNNGYTLNYTLNNQNYAVDYNWANGKNYIFNFVSPSGTTTSTYNGYVNCVLPTKSQDIFLKEDDIKVYPNPSNGLFNVEIENSEIETSFQHYQIFSLEGKKIQEKSIFSKQIQLNTMPKGCYYLKIQFSKGIYIKKIIIN